MGLKKRQISIPREKKFFRSEDQAGSRASLVVERKGGPWKIRGLRIPRRKQNKHKKTSELSSSIKVALEGNRKINLHTKKRKGKRNNHPLRR